MGVQLDEQQAVGVAWVVEEEDWSGVNDCGAIFIPDDEMKFEVEDEEWPEQGGC